MIRWKGLAAGTGKSPWKPDQARKLTKLAGLVQNKPPETDEEWNEFMETWAEVATDECPIRTAVPTSASTPY